MTKKVADQIAETLAAATDLIELVHSNVLR
jgi:hypothetical protein